MIFINFEYSKSKIIRKMKKLLFGVVVMILMASCNGKNEGSDNTVDSGSVNDTVALTIAEDSTKNQTVEDSVTQEVADSAKQEKALKQDSTKTAKKEKDNKPSPNAKKIDDLLSKYMECVKFYRSESKAGAMGEDLFSIEQAASKYDKQLKKLQDQMTPEQKKKYEKAKKMW